MRSPLDRDCLCRELLESLTCFDNLYACIICVVEMREFFYYPMSESDPHILSGKVSELVKA